MNAPPKLALARKLLAIPKARRETRMSASLLIELTIDRRKVSAPVGTTIFDAARANTSRLPPYATSKPERPVGVCRVRVVDVGARVYAATTYSTR